MNNFLSLRRAGVFLLLTASVLVTGNGVGRCAEEPARAKRATLYDEKADGNRQIEEALGKARKEGKRILLQFGANWCGWCHKLHHLFESDARIAGKLKQEYIVVQVDVNNGHNADVDEKFGKPTRFGLPVLVVLDAEGKPLVTQDTGKLEDGDHHDPDRVFAFLNQWAPARNEGKR